MGGRDQTQERLVAGWLLEAKLGAGGFGQVWRAHRRHTGVVRALKLIRIEDEYAFKAWQHEIRQLDDLSHPNIVRFYDADIILDDPRYQGHAWIATELCEHSLADRFTAVDTAALGAEDCDQLVEQMLAALAAAHAKSYVHRDVKPANILRHASGAWKLCDFGTARLIPQGASHADTTIIGTAPYMSPAAHRGHQDHVADLYALGVTAHEALSGRRLHHRPEGMTDSEYVKFILDTPPAVSPDLPERWQNVIRALADLDGAQGTRTAADLHSWFRRTRGREALEGAGPAGAPTAATDVAPVVAPRPETQATSSPPRQVFVPYEPPPAPAAPAPPPPFQPAPAPYPAQPQQPWPTPSDDPWSHTKVLGRRVFAFLIDTIPVGFAGVFLALAASIVLGTVADYNRFGSGEISVAGCDSPADGRTPAGCYCDSLGGDCMTTTDNSGFAREEPLLGVGLDTSSDLVGFGIATYLIYLIPLGRGGTSIGRWITRIVVVTKQGQRKVGIGRALVRTLMLPIDAFVWPIMLGLGQASGDPQQANVARRRSGDRLTGTWVLRRNKTQ